MLWFWDKCSRKDGWARKQHRYLEASSTFSQQDAFLKFREVKHHVYVKRQTRICTTWLSFLLTCHLLFIISRPKLAVSRSFLCIRIVLSCFYLLIFSFEKFSTWIWRLPFTVYVKLKLFFIILIDGENLLLIFLKISLQQLLSQSITISAQFNVIWSGGLPF